MNISDILGFVWDFRWLWLFSLLFFFGGSVFAPRGKMINSFVSDSELISFKVLISGLFVVGCGRVFFYILAWIGTCGLFHQPTSPNVPYPFINRVYLKFSFGFLLLFFCYNVISLYKRSQSLDEDYLPSVWSVVWVLVVSVLCSVVSWFLYQ